MKLKDLISEYGEYEVSDKLIAQFNKPKPKTVWDLKDGDQCIYIDAFGKITGGCLWNEVPQDERARDVGNIFLTKEEAEKDVERRKVETLLLKHGGRRYFDGHNHNYHIGLDEYERHLKAYILMTPTQGTIYFDTSARAKKAISEIGEERIKKALFEVR